MKLGKLTLTGLILAFGLTTNAQDSNCGENEADFVKHKNNCLLRFKSKNYMEALPFFQKAWKACPVLDKQENFHKIGIKIYKNIITEIHKAEEQDLESKRQKLDSLYMLYDGRIEHFGKKADLLYRYGADVIRFDNKDNYEKGFNLLSESLEMSKEKSSLNLISYYYTAAAMMKKAKKKDLDFMITEYFKLSDYLEAQVKAGGDKTKITGVQEKIDKRVLIYLTDCKTIEDLVVKQMAKIGETCEEKLPQIEKLLDILNKKKCTDSETYKSLVIAQYECGKTHKAAEGLAYMYAGEKNYKKAHEYIKEAISMATEVEATEDVLKYKVFALSTAQQVSSCSEIKKLANEIKSTHPKKAWSALASCLIKENQSCGTNKISQKSIYWLASDYMEKAGKGKDYYKSNYPTVNDLFSKGLSVGDSYTLPCTGDKVVIRSKD